MLKPRIIPCLLISNNGLVKTVKFKESKYIGDPINAVKIFNEKQVDELIILDIDASVKNKEPDYNMIRLLAAECRMPLCYGGGVKTPEQAKKIVGLGVEKVAVSSAIVSNPELVSSLAREVGNQSIVAVLDVKKNRFGNKYEVCIENAKIKTGLSPMELGRDIENYGAGEVVINFVDRDGTMEGYDLDFAKVMRDSLNIPITILGGAGSMKDIEDLINHIGVAGAAAGSLFVFKGIYRAVLINYPNDTEKELLYSNCMSTTKKRPNCV